MPPFVASFLVWIVVSIVLLYLVREIPDATIQKFARIAIIIVLTFWFLWLVIGLSAPGRPPVFPFFR